MVFFGKKVEEKEEHREEREIVEKEGGERRI